MSTIGKPRHHWSDPVRFPHKTERECTTCGLVKVTRHEPGDPNERGIRDAAGNLVWTEYWRDGERLAAERLPACGERERAAA